MALLPGQPDEGVQARASLLARLLASYQRIGITGAPGTGKSFLADTVGDRAVVHCDAVLPCPWADTPAAVIALCQSHDSKPLIVEGCQVPWAVRAGLQLDAIFVLETAVEEQTAEHITLGKSVNTVLAQIAAAQPSLPIIFESQLARRSARFATASFDSSNWEPTPQGGIRIKGVELSRADVFEYVRGSAIVREYRPATELQRPEAIASLTGATITVSHPPEGVDAANFRELVVGHVENVSWDETRQALIGDLVVNDAQTVARIESGELCEVSCGYDHQFDDAPGAAPNGKPFDRTQVAYVFNHTALGPRRWSRQGTAFSLDADDNQLVSAAPKTSTDSKEPALMPPDEENKAQPPAAADQPPVPEQPPAPPAPAQPAAPDPAAIAEMVAMLPLLKEIIAAFQAQQSAAAAPPPATPTTDAADVEAVVRETVALHKESVAVLGSTYVPDGKTNRSIRLDVIKSADSKFTVTDQTTDASVIAAYTMALNVHAERAKRTEELSAFRLNSTTDSQDERPARIGANAYAAWAKPLGKQPVAS